MFAAPEESSKIDLDIVETIYVGSKIDSDLLEAFWESSKIDFDGKDSFHCCRITLFFCNGKMFLKADSILTCRGSLLLSSWLIVGP